MSSVVAQPQSKPHWKDIAIREAGRIADAWEVFIAYGAQLAAWILFFCMVANILQMLPHVSLPGVVVNVVMSVQIVTLDIAGFGLNTLAKNVAKHGNEETKAVARGARALAKCLIGIMIVTLLLIAIGWLYPSVKPITDLADRLLILGRVILTVIYMHTMHDLREAQSETQSMMAQAAQEKSEMAQRLDTLSHQWDRRLATIETNVLSLQQSSPKESQIVARVEEKLQPLFAGWLAENSQQYDQLEFRISQLFDLLKSEEKEEKNTDELAAVIQEEIIEEIAPEIVAEIPEEIPPQKAEKLEEKIPENWNDVIEKFPGVNEWLSSGLRSVSVEQIMEVTNFNKIKIGKAKLRQTKNGNKRLENVLDWLRNTPVNIEGKKEGKKPRNTQPLNPGMLEEITVQKSRNTIKLSLDDLAEQSA